MMQNSKCQKYSDEELVVLSLTDSDYYACLVNRYAAALERYIIRLGSSTSDADDILQEVFMNAYLHLNDFDKKLKFSAWIYRIAHNQTITWFRKINVRPTVDIDDLAPWQELVLSTCPHNDFDQSALKDKVKIILDKLDSKYREILVLKYFEEKDYNEMSDILKKPMGTIATLVNRAKKQFIKLAEDQKIN